MAVTETIVKTQGSVWWGPEMMEVESGVTKVKPSSFQHILLQQKRLLSIPGTTTGTSLSILVTVHTLQATLNCREDV